jgi:hypothetical protein
MTLTSNAGAGVYASMVPSLSVFNSTVSGSGGNGISGTGDGSDAQTFDLEHNVLAGLGGSAISLSYAGNVNGRVDQNQIGTLATVAGDGIDLWSSGTVHADVSGNTIRQIGHTGISAETLGTGTLDLILSTNQVTMSSTSSQNGVTIAAGSGGAGTVCVKPTLNIVTAAGSGTGSGTSGMLVQQLDPNSLFEIDGYTGPDAATYLESNNTLTGGSGGPDALAKPFGINGFSEPPGGACTPPATT